MTGRSNRNLSTKGPRKFQEKIQLLKNKEHETDQSFESIMDQCRTVKGLSKNANQTADASKHNSDNLNPNHPNLHQNSLNQQTNLSINANSLGLGNPAGKLVGNVSTNNNPLLNGSAAMHSLNPMNHMLMNHVNPYALGTPALNANLTNPFNNMNNINQNNIPPAGIIPLDQINNLSHLNTNSHLEHGFNNIEHFQRLQMQTQMALAMQHQQNFNTLQNRTSLHAGLLNFPPPPLISHANSMPDLTKIGSNLDNSITRSDMNDIKQISNSQNSPDDSSGIISGNNSNSTSQNNHTQIGRTNSVGPTIPSNNNSNTIVPKKKSSSNSTNSQLSQFSQSNNASINNLSNLPVNKNIPNIGAPNSLAIPSNSHVDNGSMSAPATQPASPATHRAHPYLGHHPSRDISRGRSVSPQPRDSFPVNYNSGNTLPSNLLAIPSINQSNAYNCFNKFNPNDSGNGFNNSYNSYNSSRRSSLSDYQGNDQGAQSPLNYNSDAVSDDSHMSGGPMRSPRHPRRASLKQRNTLHNPPSTSRAGFSSPHSPVALSPVGQYLSSSQNNLSNLTINCSSQNSPVHRNNTITNNNINSNTQNIPSLNLGGQQICTSSLSISSSNVNSPNSDYCNQNHLQNENKSNINNMKDVNMDNSNQNVNTSELRLPKARHTIGHTTSIGSQHSVPEIVVTPTVDNNKNFNQLRLAERNIKSRTRSY